MTENETIELVGRLAIERSSDLKRLAAIKEDVENMNMVDDILLAYVKAERPLNGTVLRHVMAPVSQYFNTEALVGMLAEFELLEKRVSEASQQLRGILGVDV